MVFAGKMLCKILTFPMEGSVEVVEQGEKERNSGSREAVGRFLDNWDLGSPGLRPEWLRNEDIRLSPPRLTWK